MEISTSEVKRYLKAQRIETPSWGYADSGTRFNVFKQKSAAHTLEQKLCDAAQVHRYTGVCPSVALHIPWDITDNWNSMKDFASDLGLEIGAINPNLFQDDDYLLGSLCNPDGRVRQKAVDHIRECIQIAKITGSSIISLWIPDGTNYPGQDSFRERKERAETTLAKVYEALTKDMRLLLEYKFCSLTSVITRSARISNRSSQFFWTKGSSEVSTSTTRNTQMTTLWSVP